MHGKCVTRVEDGEASVVLKRMSLWGTRDDSTARLWRYRILCSTNGCMGEMRALDTDALRIAIPIGSVLVRPTNDEHLFVDVMCIPPVYILRPPSPDRAYRGIIEHIGRAQPRRPSLHSPDARTNRVHWDGSAQMGDGSLWPEFADRIFVEDRPGSVSYDIGGDKLPLLFRCPLCGELSVIGREVMPMRINRAA